MFGEEGDQAGKATLMSQFELDSTEHLTCECHGGELNLFLSCIPTEDDVREFDDDDMLGRILEGVKFNGRQVPCKLPHQI